jgi:hypothetical protein
VELFQCLGSGTIEKDYSGAPLAFGTLQETSLEDLISRKSQWTRQAVVSTVSPILFHIPPEEVTIGLRLEVAVKERMRDNTVVACLERKGWRDDETF